MDKTDYKIYKYRWIILLTLIPIFAMTNVFWLTFASITDSAVAYYHVTPLSIAFLSMSYMIIYIIMAIPASLFVDSKGFRASVSVGAALIAFFGMIRGIYAFNFTIVVIAQLGAAIGQPFLVNSSTKIAARWFPTNERAIASGIATASGYIGMIVVLVLSPILDAGFGIEKMLMFYGIGAVICAMIFIVFSKEYPPTPSGPSNEVISKLNYKDIRKMIKKKDYMYLMIAMFIIMGIFNALMTWTQDVLKPRGITSTEAGIIGAVLVIVGLVGAIVLPTISDKIGKRRRLLIWPIMFCIPGFIGIAFSSSFSVLLISAGIAGFFVLGMGPVAFQYGAEVAYPVPEGISFGILMLMGQISGIIFIYLMDLFRLGTNGDMTISLIGFIILLLISFLIALKLKESPIILKSEGISETFPSTEEIDKIKELVCSSGKKLQSAGLVSGTWGNISHRINSDYLVITPSGKDYSILTPDDMVVVNINNLKYEGNLKPSGETGLHVEIYKNRKEVNAIIHMHSDNACTVAAARTEVPPLLDDMVQIIGPSIRVADYAISGTDKLAKASLKAMSGRNGVLLANHGAVCIGRNMGEAFVTCEIMEKACKTFIEVQFLGGGVSLNKIEAKIMHEYFLRKYSKQ